MSWIQTFTGSIGSSLAHWRNWYLNQWFQYGDRNALMRVYIWEYRWASQVALVVKNLPSNGGDTRDTGSIPRSRRSPGEGSGNPLQYFCLENSMDREACQATIWCRKESDTTEHTYADHTSIKRKMKRKKSLLWSRLRTCAWHKRKEVGRAWRS